MVHIYKRPTRGVFNVECELKVLPEILSAPEVPMLVSVIQILLVTREGEGAFILREVAIDHVALHQGLCAIDHVVKLDTSYYY